MYTKKKLPERTKYFFDQFVNAANKQILHPLDWKRFYIFIQACHEGNTKLLWGELERLLIDNGFPEENASSLSNIYYHGRNLLESRVNLHYVYNRTMNKSSSHLLQRAQRHRRNREAKDNNKL